MNFEIWPGNIRSLLRCCERMSEKIVTHVVACSMQVLVAPSPPLLPQLCRCEGPSVVYVMNFSFWTFSIMKAHF